jgi:hypothetical protein
MNKATRSSLETAYSGNSLVGPVPGYDLVPTTPAVPKAPLIERFEDSLVNTVNKVGHTVHEISDAAHLDLEEFNGNRNIQVLKGLGGIAFIGLNAAHVRNAITPLQFYIAHEVKPSIAGMVLSSLLVSLVHAPYFGLYANTLRSMTTNFKHTTETVGKALSLDKLNPAGLAPKPIVSPDDSRGLVRRKFDRFNTRLDRSFVMHGTTTMAYVFGAALQGQSYEEQRTLCRETSIDGAVFAFFKGIILTGVVAGIGTFDPNLADGIYRYMDSFKGVASVTAFPFVLMGIGKTIKKLRNSSETKQLPVPTEKTVSTEEIALLPANLQPFLF